MTTWVPFGVNLLSLPTGGGGPNFSVPTPATPSAPGDLPLHLAFDAVAASGFCRWRPIASAVLAGRLFIANGYDQPAYWDGGSNLYDMGSTVPLASSPDNFAVSEAASGTAFAAARDVSLYVVYRNSSLNKETSPLELTNTMVGTKDLTVTWVDRGGEWDKVRIYRQLEGTGAYVLDEEVAASAGTKTLSSADSALLLATPYVRRYRQTLPPVFQGIVSYRERLWGWTGADSVLHYSQQTRADGEFVQDDFQSLKVLEIGPEDGLGHIVACVEFAGSLLVFKRHGVYEIFGDQPATARVRLLYSGRGCIAQRSIVQVEDVLFVLDEDGVYMYTGGQPVMAGTSEGQRDSPLSPIWDRLNLDAADQICARYIPEKGAYEVAVPLDFDPTPEYIVGFDVRAQNFTAIHHRPACALGDLRDAPGRLFPVRLDDFGQLWQDDYGDSDGVLDGDLTATVTGETGLGIDCSGATFDTTDADGSIGAPFDRYDSAGTVVDENRVAAISASQVTPLFWSDTVVNAGDSVALGVIPARALLASNGFGSDEKKFVDLVAFQFEKQATGLLRVDSAFDSAALARAKELDLTIDGHARAKIKDRGFRWHLQISSRMPSAPWAVTGIWVKVQTYPDRSP